MDTEATKEQQEKNVFLKIPYGLLFHIRFYIGAKNVFYLSSVVPEVFIGRLIGL